MQRGAYMKFYNCRNKNGFDIDGSMDQFERKFDEGFCNWEMVSGKSGTYLRTIDLRHDLEKWFGPESFMRSWYYDNSLPIDFDDFGAPVYPNDFALCSATLDNQVNLTLKITPWPN